MIVQYQNLFSHSIIADFYHVCNLTLFLFVYFLRIASTEKSYIFIKLDLKFEEKGCLFNPKTYLVIRYLRFLTISLICIVVRKRNMKSMEKGWLELY